MNMQKKFAALLVAGWAAKATRSDSNRPDQTEPGGRCDGLEAPQARMSMSMTMRMIVETGTLAALWPNVGLARDAATGKKANELTSIQPNKG
jgi:hypothetical protein